MIDTENLRTASLYLNNQLLSRGLVRDGESIDFADPAEDGGDMATAMGRIITLVNDLMLRRDRDAENRESLSVTMRTLRADNAKYSTDLARLAEKHAEAQRKADLAAATEMSARTQLKSAEAAMRGLKDELARTKALVAQARASCATEVRRRDRQIDTLKKQLAEAGRARGSRGNPGVTTIHVTGGVGVERAGENARGTNTDADDYDLRSETNGFLASLAQTLGEENEAVLQGMRQTMAQLREMSGWGTGEFIDGHVEKQPSWEETTAEMDQVLAHMRTILTNPSFVPIEDVMVREEEITRLKSGWVKMEDRWQEAVHLIEGWRRRMAANGEPVRDEELQMGLRLSPVRVDKARQARDVFKLSALAEGLEEDEEEQAAQPPVSPSPRRAEPASAEIDSSSHVQPDYNDDDRLDFSSSEDELAADDGLDDEEPNIEILNHSTAVSDHPTDESLDSSPLPAPPQLTPLKHSASAGNRRPVAQVGGTYGGRKPATTTSIPKDNTTSDLGATTSAASSGGAKRQAAAPRFKSATQPRRPPSVADRLKQPARPSSRTLQSRVPKSEPDASLEDELSLVAAPSASTNDDGEDAHPAEKTPARATAASSSRLALARGAEPQQSPLTMTNIAAKLAASEREADAARVRGKLKAMRGGRQQQQQHQHGDTGRTIDEADVPQPPKDIDTHCDPQQGEAGDDGAAEHQSHEDARMEDVDPVKHDPVKHNDNDETRPAESQQAPQQAPSQTQPTRAPVVKRKRDRRTSKVASRRRSTLSPWELESLISGQAAGI